jgi:hypothetical protein
VSELLDRLTILSAFEKLSSELARRGVRADLFVVGGAAMALAYQAGRRTRDVDAVFAERGTIYEGARAVARRMGLPGDWLNDAVRDYLLGGDPDATVVYESESLQVAVGSAPYVLAMKLLAARVEQDRDDIRALYERCGFSGVEDGLNLLRRYLPDEPVPEATLELLEAMYGPAGADGRLG